MNSCAKIQARVISIVSQNKMNHEGKMGTLGRRWYSFTNRSFMLFLTAFYYLTARLSKGLHDKLEKKFLAHENRRF